MKERALVSVIISIYNESVDLVSQAIKSIRVQTYKNLEIILLLDCPENKEVREYLQKIEKEDERINCLFNEKNLGLVKSLNKGIKHSHGEFICRMDADDEAKTDRIEKQLEYMRFHELDIVGSYIGLMNVEGKKEGYIRKYPRNTELVYLYLKYSSPIPHPTWLIRSEVYSKLNGYRNISYVEDYDFLVRAKIYGFKMGNVPEALLYYRINSQGITQTNIAKQKILSSYIAKQLKDSQIYDEANIFLYLKRHIEKQKVLEKYYTIGKFLKARKKVKVSELFFFIFNYYNLVEVWQRFQCKWIMYKDGKYDYY